MDTPLIPGTSSLPSCLLIIWQATGPSSLSRVVDHLPIVLIVEQIKTASGGWRCLCGANTMITLLLPSPPNWSTLLAGTPTTTKGLPTWKSRPAHSATLLAKAATLGHVRYRRERLKKGRNLFFCSTIVISVRKPTTKETRPVKFWSKTSTLPHDP